jgi:glutaconate CoA-transferase subunit B
VYRPGGPHALVTNMALFGFDRQRGRFRLDSVHPGHTVEEIRDNTGFEFDLPDAVPVTPAPEPDRLARIRQHVAGRLGEFYPEFAARVFPATA